MYLTSTEVCNFVIFSSHDHSFVNIKVNFDVVFMKKFLSSLHGVYFNELLPRLVHDA